MSGKSWVLATASDLVEMHPIGSRFPPVQPSVPATGVLFITHGDTVATTSSGLQRPLLGRNDIILTLALLPYLRKT